ncbi:hypothetical protein BaRGS_00022319 [Batillaria attramentaria]|uniref:Uncharacterized protein n=1 Tax=Batillaria attramentaria TaxID=370345 RepID=A0ABD0KHD4_9CAEN
MIASCSRLKSQTRLTGFGIGNLNINTRDPIRGHHAYSSVCPPYHTYPRTPSSLTPPHPTPHGFTGWRTMLLPSPRDLCYFGDSRFQHLHECLHTCVAFAGCIQKPRIYMSAAYVRFTRSYNIEYRCAQLISAMPELGKRLFAANTVFVCCTCLVASSGGKSQQARVVRATRLGYT